MASRPKTRLSPLSRTVKCDGVDLHVEITEDGDGQWRLSVSSEEGVTTHWTEPFRSDRAALKAALKTIREEGIEEFRMEQPYKRAFH